MRDKGRNVRVCDAKVRALVVGTGEAVGVHALRCSPPAFDLPPGAHRRRAHTRRDGAREATGRAIAWGAWLEKTLYRGAFGCSCRMGRTMMGPAKWTKPQESEHEEEQRQEQENMKGHKDTLGLRVG